MQATRKTVAWPAGGPGSFWRVSWGFLTIALLGCPPLALGQSALPPEFKEVAEAYRRHYSAIKTLRVVYEQATEPLIDREVLWRQLQMYGSAKTSATVVVGENQLFCQTATEQKPLAKALGELMRQSPGGVQKGTGGFRKGQGGLGATVSLAEIERALADVPAERSERTLVYDGSVLLEKSPHSLKVDDEKRGAYQVHDTSNAQQPFFPRTYLLDVLFPTRLPSLARDDELAQDSRIPDLVSRGPGPASIGRESVDGREYVVVDVPTRQKLWLDAQLAYAVRRRQAYLDGSLWTETVCTDHVEVVSGVWLPKTLTRTTFARNELPEQYRGKPYLKTTIRVSTVEANRPEHAAFFTRQPEAGAFVFDERLRPLDAKGQPVNAPPGKGIRPGVSYVQPADKAALDQVITRARQEQGAISGAEPPGKWTRGRSLLVLLGLSACVAGAVFLLVRRFRRGQKPRAQS